MKEAHMFEDGRLDPSSNMLKSFKKTSQNDVQLFTFLRADRYEGFNRSGGRAGDHGHLRASRIVQTEQMGELRPALWSATSILQVPKQSVAPCRASAGGSSPAPDSARGPHRRPTELCPNMRCKTRVQSFHPLNAYQSVISAQGISNSSLLRSWPVEEVIDGSDKDCRNVIGVHSAKLVSCCR